MEKYYSQKELESLIERAARAQAESNRREAEGYSEEVAREALKDIGINEPVIDRVMKEEKPVKQKKKKSNSPSVITWDPSARHTPAIKRKNNGLMKKVLATTRRVALATAITGGILWGTVGTYVHYNYKWINALKNYEFTQEEKEMRAEIFQSIKNSGKFLGAGRNRTIAATNKYFLSTQEMGFTKEQAVMIFGEVSIKYDSLRSAVGNSLWIAKKVKESGRDPDRIIQLYCNSVYSDNVFWAVEYDKILQENNISFEEGLDILDKNNRELEASIDFIRLLN